ncbi:MAG: hypothetical protein IPL01_04640 [Acidobacteria bacterium]|nr:hypothetical protein [Acidobacteriota bacterium]
MRSRVVTFSFRTDVSGERQDQILNEIAGWKQIEGASHLNRDAKLGLLQRLCYAYVSHDADTDDVVRRLNEFPEIETASEPPRRHL